MWKLTHFLNKTTAKTRNVYIPVGINLRIRLGSIFPHKPSDLVTFSLCFNMFFGDQVVSCGNKIPHEQCETNPDDIP